MQGFVQGADRQQTTLLPECLDQSRHGDLQKLSISMRAARSDPALFHNLQIPI
jgi:hypothetical protein